MSKFDDAFAILQSIKDQDDASLIQAQADAQLEIISLTLDLTTARLATDPFVIGFPFRSVFIREATDQLVNVNMRVNSRDSMQGSVAIKLNDSFTLPRIVKSGYLHWSAQSGKSITLVFFLSGEFRSGSQLSLTAGGTAISEGSSVTNATKTLTAGAASVIFTANTLRKVGMARNTLGETIYLGPAGVDASTGFPWAVGEVLSYKNTAALYGYTVGGGTLNILEEA